VKNSSHPLLHLLLGVLLLCAWPMCAATLILPNNPTPEERTFGAALANALATTNVTALIALHYCERDEPWAADWFFRQLLKHPCDEVRLERVDSVKAQADLSELHGARSMLPLRWLVVLRQPPLPFEATSTNTTVLPASLRDGSIVITRRTAAFTPLQKQLLLAASALAMVLSVWYALKFALLCWGNRQALRYSPLGLAVLLLCFGIQCARVVFAMSDFAPQPLRILFLPVFGLVAFFTASIFDDRRKRPAPSNSANQKLSPLGALAQVWRAWKNGEGPFASTLVTSTVLLAIIALACWLGAYLWRGTSIQLHEKHIQGRVVQSAPKQGIHYVYSVDGRQYSGSGVGSFDRYYPVGSPLDVKYSVSHPAYSTIDDDPFLFLKQITCGLAIMLGFALLAGSNRRSAASANNLPATRRD
jgi:hypothetical protein